MLSCYDLAGLEPELFARLAVHRQPQRSEEFYNAKSRWNRSGPGPVALVGNSWASGVMLAPLYAAPACSSISAISYRWDGSRLLDWAPMTEVRLLLTDAQTMESWIVDVTSSPEGTLIIPAGTRISANCQAVLQMTTGLFRGRLRNPPYIPNCDITVRYRF
jgi:hypothetical protein